MMMPDVEVRQQVAVQQDGGCQIGKPSRNHTSNLSRWRRPGPEGLRR